MKHYEPFKNLLMHYAIEHDYRFFSPYRSNKYQFKHISKIPEGASILDNSEEDYQHLYLSLYDAKNWKIAQNAHHVFSYCLDRVKGFHKKSHQKPSFYQELLGHYFLFSPFDDLLSYFIKEGRIDKAKDLFTAELDPSSTSNYRDSQSEEKMISRMLSVYDDKYEFLSDVKQYLSYHAGQYSGNNQFMLCALLQEHFCLDELDCLKEVIRLPQRDKDDIFKDTSQRIEQIIFHRENYFNSFDIGHIEKSQILTGYYKIMNTVTDYLNDNFKDHGIESCMEHHTGDNGLSRDLYRTFHVYLQEDAQVSKKQIQQFFTSASHAIAEDYRILEDEQKLNSILLHSKMSAFFDMKASDMKKNKI